MAELMRACLVPAAVFVSVVIGGGYGTGREVVQFFTRFGLVGGLLAMLLAVAVFALVLFCTYEFARRFELYDYRSFFRELLGRYWFVFEVLYVFGFVLVVGVVGSAADGIMQQRFGLAPNVGMAVIMALVVLVTVFGRAAVERVLTAWFLLMLGVFAAYFVQVYGAAGERIVAQLAVADVSADWWHGGVLYPMYNLAVAPVLLFSVRAMRTTRHAAGAALLGALLVMVPAALFHVSFAAEYPAVLEQPVPNYWMIERFASPALLIVFVIALLGTLVQTAVGLIQGLIERLQQALRHRPGREDEWVLGKPARAGLAAAAMLVSAAFAQVGIIELIASGYTALSVAFAIVYVLPVCTVGAYRLWVLVRR